MKTFLHVLGTIIYSVLILVSLSIVFGLFKHLVIWMFDALNYLELHLNRGVFWISFVFFGITIIKLIYSLFKIAASFILMALSNLSPYRNFRAWFTMISTLLYAGIFIYNMWSENGWPNIVMGVSCIYVTLIALSLVSSFTNAAYTKSSEL